MENMLGWMYIRRRHIVLNMGHLIRLGLLMNAVDDIVRTLKGKALADILYEHIHTLSHTQCRSDRRLLPVNFSDRS